MYRIYLVTEGLCQGCKAAAMEKKDRKLCQWERLNAMNGILLWYIVSLEGILVPVYHWSSHVIFTRFRTSTSRTNKLVNNLTYPFKLTDTARMSVCLLTRLWLWIVTYTHRSLKTRRILAKAASTQFTIPKQQDKKILTHPSSVAVRIVVC